jgi:lycopene cyclase domain-containing protein
MSYLQFLLIFLVPPIVAFGVWQRIQAASLSGGLYRRLGVIALIALVYTTPWDNYLIAIGAWTYPPGSVLGTIGLVPIEEYSFFVLQPIATGLLFAVWKKESISRTPGRAASRVGVVVGLATCILGAWALWSGFSEYLGLILVWSGPVVVLQWAYDGRLLARTVRFWLVPLVAATAYLWVADAIAIGIGIWSISEAHTVGWSAVGLPIEEMVFFLVTNAMVLFGLVLLEGSSLAWRQSRSSSA